MKTIASLLLALVLGVSDCAADMAPLPFALSALSPDGSKIVRVERGIWAPSPGRMQSPTKVAIYGFDATSDTYSLLSHFDLGDELPSEFLYVTNDAKYVIAVNIGMWVGEEGLGIRVYDPKGKLLRRWKLKEFLTEEEIKSIPRSVTSAQWFEPRFWVGGVLTFMAPPEIRIRRFELDVSSLDLKRK